MFNSIKEKLRTIFKFSILICLFSILFSLTAFANTVDEIDIDIVVRDNGSAIITQQWTGSFNDGTEVYLPIEDKSLIIKDFKVWRNGRQYSNAQNWDVDASFENKKWKCGINKTSKGVELCFGITEYGYNTYQFSYLVDPLVKSYTDYDGFLFRFVNPNMGTFPTAVKWKLSMENGRELTTDIARIWGFGFDGNAVIQSGVALAVSSGKLSGSNHVTMMMNFNKGLITPNISVDDSFENLKNKAFEGSSYNNNYEYSDSSFDLMDFIIMMTFIFIFVLSIAIIVIVAYIAINRGLTLKRFYKNANYFRDTPNNGDMSMSYVLFKDFDIWNSSESNIIGAIIMKLINDGNLEPLQEKSIGFFGSEKINTSLKMKKEPTNPLLKELYDIIISAAGSDGILQESELKEFAKQNDEVLVNYLDSIEGKGHNALYKLPGYKKLLGKNLKDLNDAGQHELGEVYGLRKFLDEFTLIKERSIMEGVIWEDLIVYATLFGIAKKVLKELKKVYPEKIVEFQNVETNILISDIYYRTLFYNSMRARKAAEAASRAASGFGGSVSIGGGGGFSGGGCGGGTR